MTCNKIQEQWSRLWKGNNKGDWFREPQERQLSVSAIFVDRWATSRNNLHNYEGEDQWSHMDKTQGMAIIGQQPSWDHKGKPVGQCWDLLFLWKLCWRDKALLDIGSPITIASIECVLDALAKQQAPKKSVKEWKEKVQKKFPERTLSVNTYGEGDVNVIGQLLVTLQMENTEWQATIWSAVGNWLNFWVGLSGICTWGTWSKGTKCGPFEKEKFCSESIIVTEAGKIMQHQLNYITCYPKWCMIWVRQ